MNYTPKDSEGPAPEASPSQSELRFSDQADEAAVLPGIGSDSPDPFHTGTPEGDALSSSALPQAAEMPAPVPRARRRSPGGWVASAQSLAITVVIAVFVITFIVQAFQIPSESMENTLLIGDYLLVDKVHFGRGGVWGEILPYRPLRRGDIVVFRYPVDPKQHFVKRVIGLPGDRLRLENKKVFINDHPLRESYVIYRSAFHDDYRDEFPRPDLLNSNVDPRWWTEMRSRVQHGELIVPSGQYFVLGDNRDESLDSRYWGFVPRENIVGRPLIIYWSMRRLGRIGPVAAGAGGKLVYFEDFAEQLLKQARWNRAFHLIQ